MKINYMREFLLLASNKNYSKTAEQLYMAQSSLSRHIAAMEEDIGVPLINRTTSAFELTEAGKIAVKGFRKILTQYQETVNEIGRLSGQAVGEFRLGILYYDINDYVSVIRRTFRQYFPDVNLRLFSYQPEQQEQALFSGEIDAALIYDAESSPNSGLTVFPFLKTAFQVFFSPDHRFADMEEVKVADLNGEDLLSPLAPCRISCSRQKMDRIFSENSTVPKQVIPTENFDEVPLLLEETRAVFISSMVNPGAYPSTIQHRLLEPERYSGNIAAVWKTDCKNPLIHVLVSALKITYP